MIMNGRKKLYNLAFAYVKSISGKLLTEGISMDDYYVW